MVAGGAVDEVPANVLVVVLDDVGADQIGAYGAPGHPATPVLDGLAARGLRFDHAWATPVCSPSRAALLTGRFAEDNHVGAVLKPRMTGELPLSETTIPEALDRSGRDWHAAALGKWHLATGASPSGARHPTLQGFDRFAGSLNNPGLYDLLREGEQRDYTSWERVGFDGVPALAHTFSTTQITDDAIEALKDLPEPWFGYVAYHAAHLPLSVPPKSLTRGRSPEPGDRRALYGANVEAADTEIGRLLDALGPRLDRTLVVVVGDNGTPRHSKESGSSVVGEKGSFLEGGVRVPMIAAGPPVAARGATAALTHFVDLLPTFAELAGAPVSDLALDGVSLVPIFRDGTAAVRERVYTELRHPADGPPWSLVERAVRDRTLKVVDDEAGLRIYRFDAAGNDVEVARAALTEAERAQLAALEAELARHPR